MSNLAAKVALLNNHRAEAARLQLEIAEEIGLSVEEGERKKLVAIIKEAGIKPPAHHAGGGDRGPITATLLNRVMTLRRAGNLPKAILDQVAGLTPSRLNYILYTYKPSPGMLAEVAKLGGANGAPPHGSKPAKHAAKKFPTMFSPEKRTAVLEMAKKNKTATGKYGYTDLARANGVSVTYARTVIKRAGLK